MENIKFHIRVEELICGWSMMHNHSFTEQELNSLVDLIGDDIKNNLVVGIHKHGVKVGKQLQKMDEANKDE